MRRDRAQAALMENRAAGSDPPLHEMLLAIFQDNFFPFRDHLGTPLVMLFDTPGVAVGLDDLKPMLGAGLYELYGRQASDSAFSTVINTIKGIVMRTEVPERKTWLRTGRTPDGHIGLDLGWPTGECVVIWPGGWDQVLGCGVIWRRISSIDRLPAPVRGGDISPALELINLPDRDHRALWLAARLHQFMPDRTKPVEVFTGMAGAAKTGSTRLTVAMLGGLMASMPKEPRDWAALAANTQCLGHDNVSAISADRSDLLCKAASGDAWTARRLYKDADLFRLIFQPISVVLNTIEAGTSYRGDLVRRGVIYRVLKLAHPLFESELEARWQAAWPLALGWLLDALSWILTWLDQVEVPEGETMPDFAKMVLAVDRWMGTNAWRAWKQAQLMEYGSSLYDDIVSWAIVEQIHEPWEGKPKDLLYRLMLPDEKAGPWTPERLSRRIDRAATALEAAGWIVRRIEDRHANTRRVLLVPPSHNPSHPSQPI